MKNIILLFSILFLLSGCNDVENLLEDEFKDAPQICKEYLKIYDGRMVRGKSAVGITATMNYCIFTENYKRIKHGRPYGTQRRN